MRKFLILFGLLISVLAFARPVFAQTSICNKACQVNEECGQGYRCYVGVCRALACPSSQTCGCVLPTPTPLSQTTTSIKATPSVIPKATAVATVSAGLKKTPKTGGSVPQLFIIGMSLALIGLVLRGMATEV